MGFKTKKTVNGETVWEPIKAKKYTSSKTIEYTGTLPTTINADGNALLDYRIYGNTVQNGTPTPENPIMPRGCGEKTENMFDKNNYNIIRANAGTGQGILYGVPETAPYAVYLPVTGGETYSFYSQATLSSSCFTMATPAIGVSIVLNGANTFGSVNVRTAPADAKYLVVFLEVGSVTQDRVESDLATLTVVKSPTAPDQYVPYGYKLPMVSRTENLFDGLLIGGYFINADFDTAGNNDIYKSIKVFLPAGTYTFSWGKNVNITRTVIDGNHQTQPSGSTNITSYTITSTTDGYVGISFRDAISPSTEWDVTTLLMLNLGSTSLPYVPYYREETPIYLGEVQTTRKIKKLVLTGKENWLRSTSRQGSMYFSIRDDIVGVQSMCDRATNALGINDYTFGKIYMEKAAIAVNFLNLWLFDNDISVADFKSYLAQQYAAGTPVTVWYVLAEPETAVVNEPLMEIGDYTDTISMEQAEVSIPTNKGSTVIDYNGTLKPSQMYIKYNSWSGWEDIDNYKIVNGNWTQDVT